MVLPTQASQQVTPVDDPVSPPPPVPVMPRRKRSLEGQQPGSSGLQNERKRKISFNDNVGIKTIPARCDLESDEPSSDEAPPVRHQEKSLSNYRSRIGKALILKKGNF